MLSSSKTDFIESSLAATTGMPMQTYSNILVESARFMNGSFKYETTPISDLPIVSLIFSKGR